MPALAPPKLLGKYEVGAKIGGGGMASVYVGRAEREDGTEERVALKVIRDELAHDEQFKSMFIDEAKILAQLSHPNVIQTLEYGVTGHHRFIAMELLSGRTFADVWDLLVVKGERMPPWLAAWICARVADGLHSAHELADESGQSLGVIHRDVNPSNIFLTHSGEVKLIDFGLAKARVRLSKSADGIVKGKIPYLAPEQAHGRPIDRRIDVYALGATLWEAVTMKRLFKRDTDVDTLRAIREAKIPDIRALVEGFPDELWYIIEKSLREDRDARYDDADEFRKELDDYIGGRASMMKDELSSLLTRLFPGQEARQARWEIAAASVRMPMHTMPPPAPVPIASTSMLEVSADESAPNLAAATPSKAPPASPSTLPKPPPPPGALSRPPPQPVAASAAPPPPPRLADVDATPSAPSGDAKAPSGDAKAPSGDAKAPLEAAAVAAAEPSPEPKPVTPTSDATTAVTASASEAVTSRAPAGTPSKKIKAKSKAKAKNKKNKKRPRVDAQELAAQAEPTTGNRKTWVTAVVVLLVLFALALVLSSTSR